MKKFLSIVLIVSLLSGALLFTGCSNKETNGTGADANANKNPKVQMIANTVWPPANYQTMALERFAKQVKEKTNGDITIQVEPGGALGYKGPELLKAVRDGLVPMSEFIISGVEGDEKIFGVYSLPFMINGWEEARIFNEISRPYFDKAAEKWGQKVLYLSPWPFSCLWTKEPVKSLADMKGLKTRTYDKNGALVVGATGGTPLALPFSEVYSSLATNLIDSVLTSTQTAVDAKFWEVLKYYQSIQLTMTVSIVTINQKYFNKMSSEQQKIVTDIAKEMEKEMWVEGEKIDKTQEKLCNDKGIKTVPISPEFKAELEKISSKVTEDWLKTSPEGKMLYDEFRKAVKK